MVGLPLEALPASPRYLQVYVALRERLRAGAYQPGQQLPNQQQLAREFGVSFMTLRRAVELLEREGYLVSKHGLGTFANWQPGAGPPLLIVDPEPASRAQLKEIVEGEGLRALEAGDGLAALEVAQHEPVDRVFLSVRAPGLGGGETMARLRSLRPGMSIVVAYAAVEELAELDQQNAWPAIVIRKPWQAAQVLEALRLSGRVAAQPR